jgi:hypothetical protein
MVDRGGQIILHGYTHQYDATPNPYNGMTGDDYEFYRTVWNDGEGIVELLGPVAEDSVAWVNDRIDSALAELSACGLSAIAWETPHYLASPLDYVEFGRRFSLNSGRIAYASTLGPYVGGQIYPYPTKRDVYGQRISPENLGCVDSTRLPEDIIRAAQKNLVIRDAWASAYFHPFLDIGYLQQVVEGIEALGYTYTLAPTLEAEAGPDKEIMVGESAVLEGSASGGLAPYSYSWSPTVGLSNPNATQPTASPGSTTTYTLTVTDSLGQTDSDSVTVTVISFPDVPGDFWAYDEIMACVSAGIVQGYPDGTYQPTLPVTRDQMAVYISRALVSPSGDAAIPDPEPPPTFPDVPTGNWALKYVEFAVEQGVVTGYEDGNYHPEYTVDRAQMAVYVARAMVAPSGEAGLADYVPSDPRNFPDAPDTFWSYKHIEYCVEHGVVNGYEDGMYHPEIVVTRDQMAVYIRRAFDLPMP